MRAMDAYAVLDGTTWGALALALTAVGGVLSWRAWHRRGLAAGLRGLAWTLLPLAAWLTGTLKLAARIVEDVSRWAVHLVFSPVVWVGVGIAGVAAVLFVVSGFLRARGLGVRTRGDGLETGRAGPPRPAVDGERSPRPAVSGERPPRPAKVGRKRDDDIEGMDEIEAILKKHGI